MFNCTTRMMSTGHPRENARERGDPRENARERGEVDTDVPH